MPRYRGYEASLAYLAMLEAIGQMMSVSFFLIRLGTPATQERESDRERKRIVKHSEVHYNRALILFVAVLSAIVDTLTYKNSRG